MAFDRELIELAKTSELEAIVKKTGRRPEAVLKMAKRLGVSLMAVDRPRKRNGHKIQKFWCASSPL
jgi:hypothetical protein